MNKNKWLILDPSFPPDICLIGGDFFKKRKHRVVFRKDSFLIKGFRKKFLRTSSPARKEWEIAEKLGELSPPRVALGEKGLWEYIAFKFLDDAISLEDFFLHHWPQMTLKEKRLFIDNLAAFVSEFLQKGIFQPDFHLKNILVTGPPWRFFLIDLHRARKIKGFSAKILALQLAYLLPPLLCHLTWWEIGRITNRLSRSWPLLRERTYRLHIQKLAYTLMRKHWNKKERFLNLKLRSIYFPLEIQQHLKSGQFLKELQFIKNSRKTKSGILKLQETLYFVKIYKVSPLKKCLSFFLTSRAKQAFQVALKLKLRGIPTPEPLFFGESKSFRKQFDSFIIYSFEKEAQFTGHKTKKLLSKHQENKKLLFKLTRFLWEMHERGIFHGDAKISNFIYQPGENNEIKIFDLDHVKILSKELPIKFRLKDLATLSFSLLWLTNDHTIPLYTLNTYFWLLGKQPKEEEYNFYFKQIKKRLIKRIKKEKSLSMNDKS